MDSAWAYCSNFSGINAILCYAPMVFESAGGGRDAAFLQAIVLGIVFVVMTVVSMFLIDRIGRKPLLYLGVGIMAISLTVTGMMFSEAYYVLDNAEIESVAENIYRDELRTKQKQTVDAQGTIEREQSTKNPDS